MPVTFQCGCGKTLRVKDELAGKRVKCPACGGVAAVPAAEPEFDVVEDEPPPRKPAARPVARPARDDDDDEPRPAKGKARKDDGYDLDEDDEKPAKKSAAKWKRKPDDDEDDDRPRKRRRDDDDEDEDRPRKRKKKRRAAEAESGNGGNRAGYIIGGLVCVLIGLGIAYLSYNSDARRSTGRMIGGIVMAVFGGISAIRGFTGAVPDDDEDE